MFGGVQSLRVWGVKGLGGWEFKGVGVGYLGVQGGVVLNVLCSSFWCFQRLPVTSPHGNFAAVTSPQKLRHMVTSPHFEKVKGDVGIVGKCVGV